MEQPASNVTEMENNAKDSCSLKPSLFQSNYENFKSKLKGTKLYRMIHVIPEKLRSSNLHKLPESDLVIILQWLKGYVCHRLESSSVCNWTAAFVLFICTEDAKEAIPEITKFGLWATLVKDELLSYYRLENSLGCQRIITNEPTTLTVCEAGPNRRLYGLNPKILSDEFSSYGDPISIISFKYDHAVISYRTYAEALAAFMYHNRWEIMINSNKPALYYWVKIDQKAKETMLVSYYFTRGESFHNFNSIANLQYIGVSPVLVQTPNYWSYFPYAGPTQNVDNFRTQECPNVGDMNGAGQVYENHFGHSNETVTASDSNPADNMKETTQDHLNCEKINGPDYSSIQNLPAHCGCEYDVPVQSNEVLPKLNTDPVSNECNNNGSYTRNSNAYCVNNSIRNKEEPHATFKNTSHAEKTGPGTKGKKNRRSRHRQKPQQM